MPYSLRTRSTASLLWRTRVPQPGIALAAVLLWVCADGAPASSGETSAVAAASCNRPAAVACNKGYYACISASYADLAHTDFAAAGGGGTCACGATWASCMQAAGGGA